MIELNGEAVISRARVDDPGEDLLGLDLLKRSAGGVPSYPGVVEPVLEGLRLRQIVRGGLRIQAQKAGVRISVQHAKVEADVNTREIGEGVPGWAAAD